MIKFALVNNIYYNIDKLYYYVVLIKGFLDVLRKYSNFQIPCNYLI